MGCWNETCALTHLPITFHLPVVTLTTVFGPRYKSTDSTGMKTGLLFGLPVEGVYDDYGGAEDLVNPQIQDLNEKAFSEAGFYRQVHLERPYGQNLSWWLAAHPDTLWSLTEAIKPIYYRELGVSLSDVDSYVETARAKTLTAYRLAQAALAELGKRLGAATFSSTVPEAQDQVFAIFEEVFGAERAWPAWEAIRKEGLFASRGQIFMHKAAYQAVVDEFGKRAVGYNREKTRYPVRELIAQKLDKWLDAFPAEYSKAKRLFGEPAETGSALDQRKHILQFANTAQEFALLKPMTALWMSPEVPLVGHFWGGAMPDEIVAAAGKDTIVDYLVFQWARYYLRLDFTKSQTGSQNQEVVLPEAVFKATLKMLKDKGLVKKDFNATLFQ